MIRKVFIVIQMIISLTQTAAEETEMANTKKDKKH